MYDVIVIGAGSFGSAFFLYCMKQVKPALEEAGGRYLARGGAHKVYEGDLLVGRAIVERFPRRDGREVFLDIDYSM